MARIQVDCHVRFNAWSPLSGHTTPSLQFGFREISVEDIPEPNLRQPGRRFYRAALRRPATRPAFVLICPSENLRLPGTDVFFSLCNHKDHLFSGFCWALRCFLGLFSVINNGRKMRASVASVVVCAYGHNAAYNLHSGQMQKTASLSVFQSLEVWISSNFYEREVRDA